MSLQEIREKNRLEDSFIYSSSKREQVKAELSKEDKEFYGSLMRASYEAISKHIEEIESK